MSNEICKDFKGPIPVFNKETPHQLNSDTEPIPKAENEISPKSQLKTDSFFFMRSKRMHVSARFSVDKRDSSLVSVLCMSRSEHKEEKFFYFFKAFLLPHIFAFGLTVFKCFLQELEGNFCWIKKICSCQNFQAKIYSIFAVILCDYAILSLAIFYFSIEVNFTRKQRMFCLLLYYLPSFFVTFCYVALQIDSDEFNEMPLFPIYVAFSFLFNLKNLKSMNIKVFLSHIFRIFIIMFCILVHYGLIKIIFPLLNILLSSTSFREYLIPCYQFLYFRIVSIIFAECLQIYHRYIYTFNKSIMIENNQDQTVIAIRLILLFSLTVPLGNLLSLNDKILEWVFLLSYANFIISTFTRNDIFLNVYIRIIRFFFRNPNLFLSREDRLSKECSMIISGVLLDFIFITNSRLLSWILIGKWISFPTNEEYYKDCTFLINDNFLAIIKYEGLGVIIGINSLITIGLFLYMFWKRVKVFEYKRSRKGIFNVLYLFFLHKLFDQSIQMILSIK